MQLKPGNRHCPITDLTRDFRRRTRLPYTVLFSRPARVVVTLGLGDMLRFRAERRRRSWTLPIEPGLQLGVPRQAAREAAERKARRKGAKIS
jgi:hypothetical protein